LIPEEKLCIRLIFPLTWGGVSSLNTP